MSQATRLLTQLHNGPVHSLYARREMRIGNPSQRVLELRDQGHNITAVFQRERPGGPVGVLYVLEREQVVVCGGALDSPKGRDPEVHDGDDAPVAHESLFDLLGRPTSHDPYSAAA